MDDKQHSRFIGRYSKDYYGGALMILLGLGAVLAGLGYKVGTLGRMGAGFFPAAVGAILAVVGLLIAARADRGVRPGAHARSPAQWRGWTCISLGILAFVVLGEYGGLVPATFAIVFISALGDRENTARSAALLALAMVAICVLVFWWALNIQFPLFRWG
jgi:hypothetical protein